MKTIILIAGAMLATIACDAGLHHKSGRVPDAVLASFSKEYPQQLAKRWEMKHDTCVAEFTMSKKKQSAYYFTDGNWIKTEIKLPWTKDLPEPVKSSWNKCAFNSWQIEKIDEVKTRDKNIYTMLVYQDCGPEGSIPGDCQNIYKLYFHTDGTLYRERLIE